MNARALYIKCVLAENLKEKEYNFSLKMFGTAKDFYSEHSSNIKNPLFKIPKDEAPENYTAKDFDEGKVIKTKNYFSGTGENTNPKKSEIPNNLQSPQSHPNTLNKNRSLIGETSVIKTVRVSTETSKRVPEDPDISPERKIPSTNKDCLNDDLISPDRIDVLSKRELIWQYQVTDKDVPSVEVPSILRQSFHSFFTNADADIRR